MGTHAKMKVTIPLGGQLVCGSRKLRLDSVDGNNIATVTVTRLKAEDFEIRHPNRRDVPAGPGRGWIGDDPGEGEMTEMSLSLPIGHKLRLGIYRQFRILSFDGTNAEVVVVGPQAEITTR